MEKRNVHGCGDCLFIYSADGLDSKSLPIFLCGHPDMLKGDNVSDYYRAFGRNGYPQFLDTCPLIDKPLLITLVRK